MCTLGTHLELVLSTTLSVRLELRLPGWALSHHKKRLGLKED